MLGTLCALITALTYGDAVIVLTQTPAVHTVSPGQEVVLNCNIERYDRNYINWYKQVPGGVPQYVLRFLHSSSSLSFGTGFSSDRFNSKSSSNIDYQFIIKQTETGDSAVYYCQTWDDSTYDDSASAYLIVTSSSLSPPLQSDTASLVCLSSQSVPFADVSWLAAGSPVSSGISTSTATSDWNMDKIYTCKVSLGSQTSEKTIKKSECSTE
uniref:Ig-like domain-containing protein n=1 Tax=Maylandia zebra TaxID=106582 RepID=A0A3P9CSI5_9CICH